MPDLEPTRQLLAEVFPDDAKFSQAEFLSWQYQHSPSGPVIDTNTDDHDSRLGHYAVLPQRWIRHGKEELWALSLNTAVSERARGQGLFTKQAAETFLAAEKCGVRAIVGVANAQSTPGFLGKLGFDLVGPLNVSVLPWRPSRAAAAFDRITVEDLQNEELLHSTQSSSTDATVRCWDLAELTWRLAAPNAAFSLLRGPDVLAVTCSSKHRGVPVAIILKIFVGSGARPFNLAPLASAACRHHRAPVALHAGLNPHLRIRGVSLPDRFRPSPLNLIVKSLADEPSSAFVPSIFEFLEFDAY